VRRDIAFIINTVGKTKEIRAVVADLPEASRKIAAIIHGIIVCRNEFIYFIPDILNAAIDKMRPDDKR
jgi:hypothetical protein